MLDRLSDIESLEAISQDTPTRKLFLRMAVLSEDGRLGSMVEGMKEDEELDDDTRDAVAEIASDPAFLYTVQDYLRRTHRVH